jgi:uncharacterized membrane protein
MDTKRFPFADAVALGSLALATGLSCVVFDRLPARVATHFDLHGEANGFMDRMPAAYLIPALGLGVWAFVRVAPRALPASERRRLGDRVVPAVAAVTAAGLSVVHIGILAVALVPGFGIQRPMWLALGGMYLALGLVLPRVRRNGLVGVRTPWTLASDENWARTHRVAGYTMIAAGFLAAILGTLGGPTGAVLAIGALLAGGIVPSIYSLALARRIDA